MPFSFTLSETLPADEAQIPELYASAFPEEELVPLVEALLPEPGVLSLSARTGALLIGHVLFTRGAVEGRPESVALLGPLAVHRDHQRRGVGKSLIAEGLARLKTQGVAEVLVLGDPTYYSRSGFRPASHVVPPYPLPSEWTEAWQWQRLDGGDDNLGGRLLLPQAWMRPELWG
ncbi:GNAT family N-acetyltransferase [Rhizobium sp. CRIBSB]|nr:GNAT family N-acetyltransferase [Rhizobium sp. CRIBSB]